ncbi:hypothetical protein [Paracoccus luteus]|uniref:hypothetical protein n=1 Tax=Paracoccus luteus TaxID=2508543 RepID=UPI0010700C93|nr:hypothetical protein [Paracoccus luteus]
MPELVRLYIRNIVIGGMLSVVFTTALIALDVAHLRHLVMATQGGFIAAALLLLFNALVFAGVQFAIAVMRMGDRPRRPGGGLRAPVATGRPAAAKASVPHGRGRNR